MKGNEYTADIYRFSDQTKKGQDLHNQLRVVDHWITSNAAGFMLVEGIFVPGTKKRNFWFTVESLFHKEPARAILHHEEWIDIRRQVLVEGCESCICSGNQP